MVPHIQSYAWQCTDCKTCAQCHDPADEDKMLFCDMCDRGYAFFIIKHKIYIQLYIYIYIIYLGIIFIALAFDEYPKEDGIVKNVLSVQIVVQENLVV